MFWFTLFLWAAFTVAGELLRPKPKYDTPKASSLGDFDITTAEVGRVISVVFGDCLIKGGNVTWYGDLRVDAITQKVKTGMFSSTTVTKGYRYSFGMQLSACKGFSAWELAHGSGLVEFRFDDKVIDATTHTSGSDAVKTPLGFFKKSTNYGVTSTFVGNDDNSKFQRLNIVEPKLFGGEDKEGGVQGTVDVFFGQTQAPRSDYLQKQFGTPNIPAYRGVLHCVFRQFYFGTSNYVKPISLRVRRFPWFWDEPTNQTPWNINGSANPIAMVTEALTNSEWGLGHPLALIGDSFKEAAYRCYTDGLGISMLWDSANAAADLIGDVLRHVDGVLYTDPATGLYEIALARGDYDADTLPLFDELNIVSLDMSRPSWGDTFNIAKVKYVDRAANFTEGTVERKDSANIFARDGVLAEDSFDFHGFADAATAGKAADRVLRTVSYPLAKFTLTVNRSGWDLRPGSVIRLNWEEFGIEGMPLRVTKISYGNLTAPEIQIDCVEDIFGIMETAYSTPLPTGWSDPATKAIANVAAKLVEVPYQLAGKEERQVMTYAVRASATMTGYKVLQTVNGEANVETEDVPVFTPSGRLQDALPRTGALTGASLTVYGGTDLELTNSTTAEGLAKGENLLQVDDEIMSWQDIVDNMDGTYTITGINRAVFDTVPAAHAPDARVFFLSDGVGLTQTTPYRADGTVSAKLAPYTPASELDPSTVAPVTVTMSSRAMRPNPPGLLRINNVEAPSTTVGNLVLSWAHRNKAAMLAAGVVASQDDLNQGDADGTYTVTVYIDGVAVRGFAGLAGNSVIYTAEQRAQDSADGSLPVVLRIQAVNAAGLTSAVRETEPVVMSGMGMTLGQYLGGQAA